MSSVSGCWTGNRYGRSVPIRRCPRVRHCLIGSRALGRKVIHDGSFWASTRAREVQAELYADDIIEIADADDEDALLDAKGNPVPNTARLNRDRLRIDARKWVIGRLLPRYAKKLVLEGGAKAIPVELPVREMARRVIYLLREADPKFAKKDRT